MIHAELRDDQRWWGASLNRSAYARREDVTFTAGEFRGEPGVVLIALCPCGLTSVVPLSVSPRRAA